MTPLIRAPIPFLFLVLAAAVATAGQVPPAATEDPAPPPIEGVWHGVLKVQGAELRLVFHVERGEGGGLTGSLDSPDQGAAGIPLSAVTVEKRRVRFAAASIGGEFRGRIEGDGAVLDGSWRQGGLDLPLRLERAAGAPEPPQRPQEPPTEVPYQVEDVSFDSLDAGVRLAGTLTVPAGEGPFPAVALVSGSGPQDRDEALMGHRPFAVLADHLTRAGIAVLRFDDRGVGASTGDFAAATSEDFADDAEAAFRWLRARPEVDRAAVGLLGHSEGAIVAPMVAAREPEVAFLVLIAAPAVPGEQILYRQGELILRAAGAGGDAVRASRRQQEELFAAVRGAEDLADAESAARGVLRRPAAAQGLQGQVDATIDAQVAQVATPWFRFFLVHDPAPALAEVRCPVLAVWGDKDLQVPPAQSREPLEAALAAAGNPSVTTRVLPGLNHLLQTAETGHPLEYGKIEETMAPAALELIGGWIRDAAAGVRAPDRSRRPAPPAARGRCG